MAKNILLLGRTGAVLDAVRPGVDIVGVTLHAGTTLDDVRRIFASERIDTVIMGAGIDLALRLEIVEFVFGESTATTVHMKDKDSGPEGMKSFVNGILGGLS